MSLIEHLHSEYVHIRRVRVLGDELAELIPQDARILYVGCGDGFLASLIIRERPDVHLQGIDVPVRDQTYISVEKFNDQVIPYGDASFDVVMFVDVLHHTEDPVLLLHKAVRAARKAILIKDQTLNGFLAGLTLRFLDWVGNVRDGIALPYHYWSQQQWFEAIETLNLTIGIWKQDLRLYPRSPNWLFERSLHLIAQFDLDQAEDCR